MMVVPALMAAASSVGGAVATAAGAAGAAATAGGTALTVAKGAATAFTAFSSFAAGRADGYQLEQRAQEERLLGQAEYTEARQKVTSLNREFLNIAGQQRLSFAANGVDLGSGSVAASRRQSLRETDRQINNQLDNAGIRKRQRDMRAKGYSRAAGQKRKSGLFGAIGKVGEFAIGELG